MFTKDGEFAGSCQPDAVLSNIDKSLINFIKLLKSLNLLSKPKENPAVVYVDDQFANREAMRMNFEDTEA